MIDCRNVDFKYTIMTVVYNKSLTYTHLNHKQQLEWHESIVEKQKQKTIAI